MRAREFLMKDAYSFDVDEEASWQSYRRMHDAYCRIFENLGLRFKVVEADSGAIGGNFSHEFMVLTASGENMIASCGHCDYAANVEKAEFAPEPAPAANLPLEQIAAVNTPAMHSVSQVAEFLRQPESAVVKTLIYLADGQPLAAMVRGDRQLNEIKLKNLLKAADMVLASAATVEELTRAPLGFAGPLGLNIPIYADRELESAPSMITGANAKDTHFTGVNLKRDIPAAVVSDLRLAGQGDKCPKCGQLFNFARGIEVGHIFRLGTKYSKAMGAEFLNRDGVSQPIIMGTYGIGVSRIVAAAIEQGNDENGVILPPALAPFAVAVMPMNLSGAVYDAAFSLYEELIKIGVDAAFDDRDLRPGIKFKDHDLIAIPYRVVVGAKGLERRQAEIKIRQSGEVKWVDLDQVGQWFNDNI
jgi:prolyl-tRNA synthetase